MADWRLFRAFACYWTMKLIDTAFAFMPRSPTKARLINTLCRPFASYGLYWALRLNPNAREIVKRLEKGGDHG